MWRIESNVDGYSKEENMVRMKDALLGLIGKIPEIKSMEVGINTNGSNTAYDVVLYSEFESEIDLSIYQKHPEHLKVGDLAKKIVTERAVVDYMV